jgi:hypothetical protein
VALIRIGFQYGFSGSRRDHHGYEAAAYRDLNEMLHLTETEAVKTMLETVQRWVPLAHVAFLEYRLNALTLSATALAVLRRMLEGEKVDQPSSALSPREWRELMAVLGREPG